MGFGGSADIFQAQIMDLMASLEFVRAYMDDMLIITRRTLDEHLQKIKTVLTRLRDAGLKVNAAKSSFCAHEIRGSGPKNVIFSNGPKIMFEWSNLLN
jgi:hypothetical protein